MFESFKVLFYYGAYDRQTRTWPRRYKLMGLDKQTRRWRVTATFKDKAKAEAACDAVTKGMIDV